MTDQFVKTAGNIIPRSDDQRTRYWDPTFNHFAIKVMPGTHYVTDRADEMIVTTLGSCVAACVRDTGSGIGGMNHFMLPESETGKWGDVSSAMRYGNYAMEVLINDILRMGGARNRLEIKLFGGANMLRGNNLVGIRNIEFVETYLRVEHMAIAAQNLGGEKGRRIVYFPESGKVKMKLLNAHDNAKVIKTENTLKSQIDQSEVEGSIELF